MGTVLPLRRAYAVSDVVECPIDSCPFDELSSSTRGLTKSFERQAPTELYRAGKSTDKIPNAPTSYQ